MAYLTLGANGIQPVDVSDPQNPVVYPVVPVNGEALSCEARVGNLYTITTNGFAHHDLTDPANPVLLGSLFTEGTPRALTTQSGFAYIVQGHKLIVVEASDTSAPQITGSIKLPQGEDYFGNPISVGAKIRLDFPPANPVIIGSRDLGTATEGLALSSGVYLARLRVGSLVESRRVVLVR